MCDLMEALAIVIVEGETQFIFWFVKTFTNAMVDKTKSCRDKSGFLTYHKHQNFLNQPINLQTTT